MRIDTVAHLTEIDSQQTTLALPADGAKTLRVIHIEPEDSIEAVLIALRLQREPVILLLPEEQSQAFSDPLHFAQLRQQVASPTDVSLVIPRSRLGTLACSAHQFGFPFASSLEKAAHVLPPCRSSSATQEMLDTSSSSDGDVATMQQTVVEDVQEYLPVQEFDEKQTDTSERSSQSIGRQAERLTPTLSRQVATHSVKKRVGLIASMVALLIIANVVLLPALFSAQSGLKGVTPAVATVGVVVFTSSGQLDPTGAKGLSDVITVSLQNLSSPPSGKGYYVWLMPDKSDDSTIPLLLGKLQITGGKAHLHYERPDHTNLLASYSGLEVAEQESNLVPTMPPLDPKAWRYIGGIPDIPTPGDEQRYSLLDHMRHLLAKDPTLQQIGLQGGLDIWLDRNSEKVLEWSSAARDSWQGGQQTALIHRQMLRALEYLDGAAYVFNTEDVPPGSPLLVDPHVGRIGLLQVSPTQVLPAFLTHVDVHLQGMSNAPGHTKAQQQLAIKIDKALKTDTLLLQKVRQDAIKLAKMNEKQLKGNDALSLLNDMVSNANTAYTGQFDATTGGNVNGVAWINNELQGLATMSVATPAETN